MFELSFRMEFFVSIHIKNANGSTAFLSFVYDSWCFFYAAVGSVTIATRAKMNFSLPERVCSSVGIVDALMLRLASRVLVCVYLYLFRFSLLFFSFSKFDILPLKKRLKRHTNTLTEKKNAYTCTEAKDWLLHHCARAIIERDPRDDQRISQRIMLLLHSAHVYEMRLKKPKKTRTLKIQLL